jgi:threonine dehydratase
LRVLPTLAEIEEAAEFVHAVVGPTPQLRWPLLCERVGAEVWVKHENHTPVGAFKVRGGLVYLDGLRRTRPDLTGVIAATRGNHGQSVAFAAARFGLATTIVVPRGNSREKNAGMRALGAELVEHGHDFQAALEFARELARERGLHLVPSYHPLLVRGVATGALEFLRGAPELDTVYVPIGLGSGICGMIAARDALGLPTRIVGVVSENAPTYALSFVRSLPTPTESAETIADGLACRVPVPDAVVIINRSASRILSVSDDAIKAAMRHYFTDTHNVAEGAGAAPLAALLAERDAMAGKRVGLVLSGGNVDRELYASILEDS